MKDSIKKGLGFGLTSGILTTLGLMVGLNSVTHSKFVVISGIITIAIADALSDSLGMHLSEESNKKNSPRNIWEATIATGTFKFIFALSFLIPVLLLELQTAIIVSIIYGLLLITTFSYYVAVQQKESKIKAISEHLFIAILIIIITHSLGKIISGFA